MVSNFSVIPIRWLLTDSEMALFQAHPKRPNRRVAWSFFQVRTSTYDLET